MATRTLQHGPKINSRQWAEIGRQVDMVSHTFHHENSARYAIFAMLRRKFGGRASELPSSCFEAALEAIKALDAQARAFMDFRQALEGEAIRRIFGPDALGINELDLTTTLEKFDQDLNITCERYEASKRKAEATRKVAVASADSSNVVPFSGRSSKWAGHGPLIEALREELANEAGTEEAARFMAGMRAAGYEVDDDLVPSQGRQAESDFVARMRVLAQESPKGHDFDGMGEGA